MKKIWMLTLGACILLSACGSKATPAPQATWTPPPPTETATVTPTLTVTPTITATFTASPSPTPTWIEQGPGPVIVPVILYHHIGISPINSRYYVPPDKFEEELKLLRDWGYTTIPVELLVKAVLEGASLPPRPIVITFDDGNLDNFTTAFPIMQKYGFTGTLYIVGNYVGAEGYLSAEDIKEMAAAGWEVGSHSMSHLDLTSLEPERQRYEIVDSRKKLEDELGVPVLTFAYPYGFSSTGVVDYVHFAGYIAAMSLGSSPEVRKNNLFLIQRVEIKSQFDVKQFADLLPWQGDTADLPTDTPAPTPTSTRTPKP